jgi:excinuclease UvrABC nuclease subunit
MTNEIKGHDYTWSLPWIEFKAPNAQGVYSLRNKEGKVIFVGKGNIRQRLLSHWNRENSTDAVVWNYVPCAFRFELTNHPAEREAELIRELKPACVQSTRSIFPKFW